MTSEQIETAAEQLLRDMWKDRERLIGRAKAAIHPLDLLEPEHAAAFLGLRLEYHTALGRFGDRGFQFEVAGYLERAAKRISVSQQFSSDIQRFTGAHEIAHYLLHPHQVPHRDRPIAGLTKDGTKRPVHEQQADRFAAAFLVPRKLLTKAFTARFRQAPLRIDERAAFWLSPDDPDNLFNLDAMSADVTYALASARSYDSQQFHSLASVFRVSVSTMAIRLEETNLVTN
jgi:hypothetical protein